MNRGILGAFGIAVGLTSTGHAAEEFKDYTGPFPTEALYRLCSDKNPAAREKCNIYIQGLMYGLKQQRSMHEHDIPVCLPDMSIDAARTRILGFIETTTQGKPATNKDGGDWIAFLALASGNICKK